MLGNEKVGRERRLSGYINEVVKAEMRVSGLAHHYETLDLNYLRLPTFFLHLNSLLFAFVSFRRLGLSFKSLSILGVILYVNGCWHWLGEETILRHWLRNQQGLVGYWHREYYKSRLGDLHESRTNKLFQEIYIRPTRDVN